MALLGIETARPARWIKNHLGALPSILALVVVAASWVVGAATAHAYLTDADSPLAMLGGLYVGLAAGAVSIIVTTLALNDLVSRYSRPRRRR
ncbi:hypothetical protein ACX80L_03970 [Arthrobacter sp. MDT1-48-3]|jgi:Kef-type K+ transport system membrane component KefB|uniref:Uncharacterized protein n=1 Tax=Arthrobacter agilis TaxID=37921 RepID=A0A2L0UHY7_9MICC|nr:hypothetical protein [Arthrobacter agilis]AUZ88847.1 hypothetical protein CVO76_15235 [Arthrobacter agilis]